MSGGIEAALENDLRGRTHRRDRVFAAAYVYQRYGLPIPGSADMRAIVGRGSLTDIQRDLKDFRNVVTENAVVASSLPGLPRDLELKMSEVMAGLWQTIYERAGAEFAEARGALETQLQELNVRLSDSEQERLKALEERQIVLGRLADLEKELLAEKTVVADEKRRVADLNAAVSALQSEIGRISADASHERKTLEAEKNGLGAALKERENRILDLQTSETRLKAAYEEKISNAQMMETEHRIRADKAETGRQVAAANAERLRESVGQLEQRLAVMKSQLEAEQGRAAKADQLAQELSLAKTTIEAGNARLEAAAREREEQKKEVARLREEIRVAVETAAELRGQLSGRKT